MRLEQAISDLIDKGMQHHRTKQWDSAIQYYGLALSIQPENCTVLLLHASLLFQIGNIEQAYNANTQLLKLEPLNANAHNLAGLIQVNKKNYLKAENCFKLAIKNSPNQYHFHASLAEVYKSQGNLQLALDEYLLCTTIDPGNAQGFYQYGLLQLKFNHINNAIKAFTHAIAIKPDFIVAHEQLAQAYYLIKEYQHALECYQHLLKYTKNKANVLNNIAIVQQASGQLSEARVNYQKSLELSAVNADVYLRRSTNSPELIFIKCIPIQ